LGHPKIGFLLRWVDAAGLASMMDGGSVSYCTLFLCWMALSSDH
jgi:hypothetical protein